MLVSLRTHSHICCVLQGCRGPKLDPVPAQWCLSDAQDAAVEFHAGSDHSKSLPPQLSSDKVRQGGPPSENRKNPNQYTQYTSWPRSRRWPQPQRGLWRRGKRSRRRRPLLVGDHYPSECSPSEGRCVVFPGAGSLGHAGVSYHVECIAELMAKTEPAPAVVASAAACCSAPPALT